MPRAFDAYEYFDYLRVRWRVMAITCGTAFIAALLASLLLPKRYTATASVLIDPPAGSDVRTATAVSPIYLESLKTYEHFANSDSLFLRAAERFHLAGAQDATSLETRKRRVLKVSKLRDTRILEISATLDDPKAAQALAQYLADETVRMSQSVLRDAEGDIVEDSRQQADGSRARLDAAQAAWHEFWSSTPIDALKGEIESLTEVSTRVQRNSMMANADVAEWVQRVKSLSSDESGASRRELQDARQELAAMQARASALESEKRALENDIKAKGEALARRIARKDQLETRLREATAAHEAAVVRLRELRGAIGFRGERLKVIDPGVVPQRPSFPNLPLNVIAALLAGIVVSAVYLSVAFTTGRRSPGTWRDAPMPAGR